METSSGSFWAGVFDAKAWFSDCEVILRHRNLKLLLACQSKFGGYLLLSKNFEKSQHTLRYRGQYISNYLQVQVAKDRVMDEDYARGYFLAACHVAGNRIRLCRSRQPADVERLASLLRSTVLSDEEDSVRVTGNGLLSISKQSAREKVIAWMGYDGAALTQTLTGDEVRARNLAGNLKVLEIQNQGRQSDNKPQYYSRLLDHQRDAILFEAPKLPYRLIATRVGCSVAQIQRLVKREGLYKKPKLML